MDTRIQPGRAAQAPRRVLICTPDMALAQAARQALGQKNYQVQVVGEGEVALRRLATTAPELLIVAMDLPGKDGAWLLRRIKDDYMGQRPRAILIARADQLGPETRGLGADAVILAPVAPADIVAALEAMEPPTTHILRAAALKELVKVSILESDLPRASKDLVRRLALAFRVTDAVLVGAVGDHQFVGVAHGPIDESPDAPLWDRCTIALDCGTAVWAPLGDTPVGTYLAVPVESSGGAAVGVLALLHDRPRLYSPDDVEVLAFLGQRLYGELAWRSVHERIAADRERLRESSLLDPLLGIWTRAALDQGIASEVSSCVRRGEPLSVAIMDVRGLRHLNERHGHAVGDAALKHVAALLRRRMRTQDRVARFAGNTLALVLSGTGADDAFRVVERMQQEIESTPLYHDGLSLAIGVTGGVAGVTGPNDTGESALARAAAAARRAKNQRIPLAMGGDALEEDTLTAETQGLEAGVTLGGMYQILHEISRGAMGVVYRAEDLGLGRPVALKTLRPDLARDENFIARFRIEAATMAQLRHESLAQVYSFGTDGDDVYFVMELVEGEPLEDRVEVARVEGRMLPLDLVERAVVQAAEALETMHVAGILHRDVKPANILMDRVRDRAVLVDFGIAKRRDSAQDPAGTPGFTAPESFQGGTEGPAADVYGLAATAYMLLTTRAPFGDDAVDAILHRQVAGRPRPPSELRPGLPAKVDELLLESLDPLPDLRPSSTRDFARRLQAALADVPADVKAGLDVAAHLEGEQAVGVEFTFDSGVNIDMPLEELGRAVMTNPGQGGGPAPLARVGTAPELAFAGGPHTGTLRPMLQRARGVTGSFEAVPVMSEPQTRGILFRSAFRVLGAREGATWIATAARNDPALSAALQPQSTMLSWHPTMTFLAMLRAIAESGRDGRRFARDLGRVAAAATFSRFFGANPRVLGPWGVVSVADKSFWPRYHSWGKVQVTADGPLGAAIVVRNVPQQPGGPLLVASVIGLFEQGVLLAGAPRCDVTLEGDEGVLDASTMSFRLRWDPEGP